VYVLCVCVCVQAALAGSIAFTILLVAALLFLFGVMWYAEGQPALTREQALAAAATSVSSEEALSPKQRAKTNFQNNLKILLTYLQISNALLSNVDLPWPTAFQTFVQYFNFVNLNFIPWGSVSCVASLSYYSKLVLIGVVPIGVLIMLGAAPLIYFFVREKTGRIHSMHVSQLRSVNRGKVVKILVFALFLSTTSPPLSLSLWLSHTSVHFADSFFRSVVLSTRSVPERVVECVGYDFLLSLFVRTGRSVA
jgi:hypothetical protein